MKYTITYTYDLGYGTMPYVADLSNEDGNWLTGGIGKSWDEAKHDAIHTFLRQKIWSDSTDLNVPPPDEIIEI
jgi:hypothetical protein